MILFIVRDAFDVGETGIVVFIFLGCFSLPALVSYATSEFTITNRRVVVKIGWLRRRTMEININKVESAGVLQGLQGRILGYGDITLTGTGGTKELLKKISRPFEFRTALINLQTRDSK
jgi:uncharacterized membrane protein YdbT with pleckstrin-like domain